jgi:hypothetical protein
MSTLPHKFTAGDDTRPEEPHFRNHGLAVWRFECQIEHHPTVMLCEFHGLIPVGLVQSRNETFKSLVQRRFF